MFSWDCDGFCFLVGIQKSYYLLFLWWITIMNICPNSFNICVFDCSNNIWILCSFVCSGECISILSEPNSKSSISILNVIIWLIDCKSGNEIPRFSITSEEYFRMSCQPSTPKSVTILSYTFQIVFRYFNVCYWFWIWGWWGISNISLSFNTFLNNFWFNWFGRFWFRWFRCWG